MLKTMKRLIGATLLCCMTTPLLALDTSEPLLCATTQVFQCVDGAGCSAVLPEAVNAPTFIRLDVKKKQLRVYKDAPPTKIASVTDIKNRIVLQGAEQGSEQRPGGGGWTMSVESDTGRFVGAIAVEQATITLFGACTEPFDA